MHVEQVITELQKFGNKRTVTSFKKMGIKTDNYLGVDIIKIKTLAMRIRKNHELAEHLRMSGIRDALLLSFMIEDPQKISKHEVKNIVKQIDYWDLTDNFCTYVLMNTTYVNELIDEWKDSSREMTKRCAYFLVHELANKKNAKLEEDYFEEFLERIEREIGYSKNWVKEAMLLALISIGSRNESLRSKAVDVANRIGRIDIHSKKELQAPPDPLKYLMKMKSPGKTK
jgi:3-methyladenine DNA glycosylase AlkD